MTSDYTCKHCGRELRTEALMISHLRKDHGMNLHPDLEKFEETLEESRQKLIDMNPELDPEKEIKRTLSKYRWNYD